MHFRETDEDPTSRRIKGSPLSSRLLSTKRGIKQNNEANSNWTKAEEKYQKHQSCDQGSSADDHQGENRVVSPNVKSVLVYGHEEFLHLMPGLLLLCLTIKCS